VIDIREDMSMSAIQPEQPPVEENEEGDEPC
jgi:hypothetical protein